MSTNTETPARPSTAATHAGWRRLRRVALWVIGLLALLVLGFLFWTQTVMMGDRTAALKVWQNPAVTIESTEHSIILTRTADGDGAADGGNGQGLVFIPGAKVDPYAYLYKLSGIVEQSGTTVVITKPTLNLAFFDTRPLSTFTADAPEVREWSVGGHSLGGVRACQLADPAQAGEPEVVGLVLFGSYCANDLRDSGLEVLSIAASNDGLSTPSKIADAAPLLPEQAVFVEIVGGNHAGFGDYGTQSGDGTATIDSAQMRAQITDALSDFGL